MKFRTDFVTNSSSSSYILKECDFEKVRKELLEKGRDYALNHPREIKFEGCNAEYWIRIDQGNLSSEELEHLRARTFRLHEENTLTPSEIHQEYMKYYTYFLGKIFQELIPLRQCLPFFLWEIIEWYWNDLLEICLHGLDHYLSGGRKTEEIENYLKEIQKSRLSEDTATKMAGLLILKFMSDKWFGTNLSDEEETTDLLVFSEEYLQRILLPEVQDQWSLFWIHDMTRPLQAFLKRYGKRFRELSVPYLGLTMGEIAEAVLGPVYVYFNTQETDYLIGDPICELPVCILGCNHMG